MPKYKLQRIVSGAQTGADRAALDVALSLSIPSGGWVPKGRIDEVGRIPDHYPNLVESTSKKPSRRTALNVRDSDGTLILSQGNLGGGSLLTKRLAARDGRPCLHIDFTTLSLEDAVIDVTQWLCDHEIKALNVAGARESKDPEIYGLTKRLLERVLQKKCE